MKACPYIATCKNRVLEKTNLKKHCKKFSKQMTSTYRLQADNSAANEIFDRRATVSLDEFWLFISVSSVSVRNIGNFLVVQIKLQI